MNTILVSYYRLINGVVIDALEHYLYLRHMKQEVQLVVYVPSNMCNDVAIIFKQIAASRYTTDLSFIDDMVIVRTKSGLIDVEMKNVMIFGSQDMLLYTHIDAEKYVIVKEHTPTKHWYKSTEKYYDILSRQSNVKLFREYDYNVISKYDIIYKSLFAFDIYKPCETVDRATFMISLSSKGSVDDLKQTVKRQDCLELISYGINLPFKHRKYKYLGSSIKDIFSLFGTYVYGNSKEFGDPRPRLFIECKFYNKDVIILGELNSDGAALRYDEFIRSTRREVIESRNMTLDNPLFVEFLN